jgi:integrase
MADFQRNPGPNVQDWGWRRRHLGPLPRTKGRRTAAARARRKRLSPSCPAGPTPFREYADRWLERGETKRGWKPSCVVAYRKRLEHLNGTFGHRPLASIRALDVAACIDDALGTLTAKTVHTHVNLLHDVLKGAVADELIPSNPVVGVERPKVQRNRWRILQPAEVPAVSKAFSDARGRRVFLTLILTGLRRSELRALRWGHVNLVEGTLRVVESKSEEGERLIALPAVLVDELMAHYRATDYRSGALAACSGYKIRVQTSPNPCRQAVLSRASPSSGRSRSSSRASRRARPG